MIGSDKIKHFKVSAAGTILISLLLIPFINPFNAIIFGAVAMLGIGIAYEIYQLITGKGHFEFLDMFADLLGCIFGLCLVSLGYWIYIITSVL